MLFYLCEIIHKAQVVMSLDFYIKNEIQLLRWPVYSRDLIPIEKV